MHKSFDRLAEEAYGLGSEHGASAASWYFDGNTPDETYAAVLRGIDEGNPVVYDTFPHSPLSGEWAGDPTPASLLEDLGLDPHETPEWLIDHVCGMYEDGFDVAVSRTIEEDARRHVGTVA